MNLGSRYPVGAPWVLVADIERGGVFASVIGTVSLLTPEERSLFRGFLINKFRGDLSLFEDGRARCSNRRQASPCLGVFPFADDLRSMPKTASRLTHVHGEGSTGSPNRHRPLSVDFQRDRFSTVTLGRVD